MIRHICKVCFKVYDGSDEWEERCPEHNDGMHKVYPQVDRWVIPGKIGFLRHHSFGCTVWDAEHDARVFDSYLKALLLSIRFGVLPKKSSLQEVNRAFKAAEQARLKDLIGTETKIDFPIL